MKGNKQIIKICNLIDQIVKGNALRRPYEVIFSYIEDALNIKMDCTDVMRVCDTVVKMAKSKNSVRISLEHDFWNLIINVPQLIIMQQDSCSSEDRDILSVTHFDSPDKRIIAYTVRMSLEIMEMKDTGRKICSDRRARALKLMGDIVIYYNIPGVKSLFVHSLDSIYNDEIYMALLGLKNYFVNRDDVMEHSLHETLGNICHKTDNKMIALTCFQIKVNAGLLDMINANHEMMMWEENRNGRALSLPSK